MSVDNSNNNIGGSHRDKNNMRHNEDYYLEDGEGHLDVEDVGGRSRRLQEQQQSHHSRAIPIHHYQNGHGQGNIGESVGSRSVPRTIIEDDEDTIETASSASYTSADGRYHKQHQPIPHQTHRNQQKHIRYQIHKMPEIPEKFRDEKDGSEIYIESTYLKHQPTPASIIYSNYSGKSRAPSEMSSVKTKTSRKGGVVVETMSAPNPFCPNTKGVCCLLVLVNLGLILVTLGFSVVLQLYDPPFVWYCGIAFLIVGFTALIASMIFCVHLCRESSSANPNGHPAHPGELYWTHHWQKRISLPSLSRDKPDDASTVYSHDSKYYNSDHHHRNMSPIHTIH